MLMPITWKQFERYWYIFALAVTIASLPFSKLGLSIGQMMMVGGWIEERYDFRKLIASLTGRSVWQVIIRVVPLSVFHLFKAIVTGFRQFSRNRAALIFSSIFLIHLVGLIFTTDFDYALKDLRTKFPIFLLPLILSTSEAFDRKGFYRFMMLFILAVLVRSVYNTWMITTHHFVDIRDVSHNVSHIIYSLLLTVSIYTLLFFLFKRNLFLLWQKGLALVILVWLFAYIVLSQSFTGLSITIITLVLLIPILIFKTRNQTLKVILSAGILVIVVGVFLSVRSIVADYYHVNPVDFTKLEKNTSRGNPYIHNIYATQTENGNYIWLYIQWDEMRGAWNRRSRIPFDSLNKKNATVAFTLVRYLTSKGWRKDADAVERLNPAEIDAIEKGVANYIFLKGMSIRGRIYELLWGFDNYRETGNPTGATLMQRFEFWKASLGIIHDHWLTGVGTGDMNLAFRAQYEKMHTKLSPDQRWRSHNQFLSIFIGFGIFGFFWFLFSLFYPPVMLHRLDDYFLLVFLIVCVLSMLTGDTIESQTGVSFFAIFYTLFLFTRKETDTIFSKDNK
ncbi:MAG: O-antigen ligase family protein [Bacteroidetes bacterium]|nr:O-antigen ligase family protein [Bacteroidota bacterium]